MERFVVDIAFDEDYNSYIVTYSNGSMEVLDATNYHDAVLEADLLDSEIDSYIL